MNRKKLLNLSIVLSLVIGFSFFNFEVKAQSKKDLKKVEKITKEGDKFFNNKDYRSAITKYAEAISIAPNLPYAHYWKGYAHYYLDEFDLALSELNESHRLGYKPIDVYKIRWFVNYKQENFDAALTDAQQVLQVEPDDNNLLVAVANIYRGKKDYANALAAYKKASEKMPDDGDIKYFVAESNYYLGDFREQGFAAIDAVRKNTKYGGEAWFLIGDALQKNQKPEDAIEAYERAVSANPKMLDAYNNLSELYRSKGMYEKSVETMEKGIKEFPTNGLLYGNLSWYHSLAGEHPKAVAAGQQAIKFAPDEYMGYTNLCRAYNDMKLFQQAINTCTTALKLKPGDGETNFYIGWAYDKLKQPNVAGPFFKKAVTGLLQFTRENPGYSDGFYLLGNAYFASGNDNGAIEAYKKTIELSPRYARARYNLGVIYFITGKKSLAEEQYNALKEIDTKAAADLLAVMKK